MAKYMVGDYIYDLRKQRGYTQEELAEGVCTTSTLSKIENGGRTPSSATYEALMQRLGGQTSLFSCFVGKRELETDRFCREILSMMARNEPEYLEAALEEYRIWTGEHPLTETQLMLYLGAVYHTIVGEKPEKVLRELYRALRITTKEDVRVWRKADRRLLTYDEIVIWNNIAIQYKRLKMTGRACDIWYGLKDYFHVRMMDEEERAKMYPVILYNLSVVLSERKSYEEALLYSEMGIGMCVRFGKLFPLPYLLNQKSRVLLALEAYNDAREVRSQSELIFRVMKKENPDCAGEMSIAF